MLKHHDLPGPIANDIMKVIMVVTDTGAVHLAPSGLSSCIRCATENRVLSFRNQSISVSSCIRCATENRVLSQDYHHVSAVQLKTGC